MIKENETIGLEKSVDMADFKCYLTMMNKFKPFDLNWNENRLTIAFKRDDNQENVSQMRIWEIDGKQFWRMFSSASSENTLNLESSSIKSAEAISEPVLSASMPENITTVETCKTKKQYQDQHSNTSTFADSGKNKRIRFSSTVGPQFSNTLPISGVTQVGHRNDEFIIPTRAFLDNTASHKANMDSNVVPNSSNFETTSIPTFHADNYNKFYRNQSISCTSAATADVDHLCEAAPQLMCEQASIVMVSESGESETSDIVEPSPKKKGKKSEGSSKLRAIFLRDNELLRLGMTLMKCETIQEQDISSKLTTMVSGASPEVNLISSELFPSQIEVDQRYETTPQSVNDQVSPIVVSQFRESKTSDIVDPSSQNKEEKSESLSKFEVTFLRDNELLRLAMIL